MLDLTRRGVFGLGAIFMAPATNGTRDTDHDPLDRAHHHVQALIACMKEITPNGRWRYEIIPASGMVILIDDNYRKS